MYSVQNFSNPYDLFVSTLPTVTIVFVQAFNQSFSHPYAMMSHEQWLSFSELTVKVVVIFVPNLAKQSSNSCSSCIASYPKPLTSHAVPNLLDYMVG